jgi:hypothetical protein
MASYCGQLTPSFSGRLWGRMGDGHSKAKFSEWKRIFVVLFSYIAFPPPAPSVHIPLHSARGIAGMCHLPLDQQ